MLAFRARVIGVAVLVIGAVSCSGGSQSGPQPVAQPPAAPPQPPPMQTQSVSIPLTTSGGTYSLPLGNGYSGTISVGAQSAPRATSVTVTMETPAAADRLSQSTRPCPSIPALIFSNPFGFPITIPLSGFTINVPCTITGMLFGVTFFTLPSTTADAITPIRLGDVSGSGHTITFVPAVQSVTFPPHSRDEITIMSEPALGYTTFPVVPNTPTILTAGSNTPTSLAFKYDAASGGTTFQAACFNGPVPGQPPVGTPSFYCNLDPGTNAITFGTSQVRFFIGVPKPDGSVLGLDGPSAAFNCKAPAQPTECDSAKFTITRNATTGFQNVVVTNVVELQECIFETCADSSGNQASPPPSPAPITAWVGNSFQVFVNDDSTYHPGAGTWDGQLRGNITTDGACHFGSPTPSPTPMPSPSITIYAAQRHPKDVASASPTSTMLPGPTASFTVTADAPGPCTIGISEDPAYITTVPGNPSRAVQETVTVQQGG